VDTNVDLWPPQVGDYARLRQGGVLGEVIDVACHGTDSRYTLNIFAPEIALAAEYPLDDLAPAWPADWT
jgi:hypothetical protein